MSPDRGSLSPAYEAEAAALREIRDQLDVSARQGLVLGSPELDTLFVAVNRFLKGVPFAAIPRHLNPSGRRRLTQLATLNEKSRQRTTILESLEDASRFDSDQAGLQTIKDQLVTRIARDARKFKKKQRRLLAERIDNQLEMVKPEVEDEDAASLDQIYARIRIELNRLDSAIACDEPSAILIHELYDCADRLHCKMSVYHDAFERHEKYAAFESVLSRLRPLAADVAHWGLVQLRCTKWIEKERDMSAVDVLQRLTDICNTRYQHEFSKLAKFLEPQPFLEFREGQTDPFHPFHDPKKTSRTANRNESK